MLKNVTAALVWGTLCSASLVSNGHAAPPKSPAKNTKLSTQSTKPSIKNMVILDKQRQLDRFTWWDNKDWAWYKEHIPFFESPDAEIDATYYYRWELATKHLTYGSPESGYNFTEFINRPGWSGRYGAISCPMGLQIYETRWLKDARITDDFIRYWFETPGAQPRSYSNWYGDAVWANYLVSGDKQFLVGRLPSMEAQYQGWLKEHWRADHQMFAWSSMHDGMEFTIGSRQTKRDFDGAESYRPTLNSYVYGDLIAMANTAALSGDNAKAARYRQKAVDLKGRIQAELWDTKRKFYLPQFADNEEKDGVTIRANTRMYEDGKYKGDPHGRELSGYLPWMFNLPDKGKGYEVAWQGVSDPEVFLAPYGLYFAERHDPLFYISPSSCWWSGNNWPYADSQVLMAMANVLNNYPQNAITKADYFKVLESYTRCQRENGRPYLAEDSDPDTGRWVQDTPNMSEHYFHSSYVDLIISGLAGLRPRADNIVEVNPLVPDGWAYFALDDVAYHGHRLSIVWDKDGTRYNRGKGLMVFADGQQIAVSPTLGKLQGNLPPFVPPAPPMPPSHNFAVNNDGSYYPRIRASFTAQGTAAANLADGNYYYHDVRPVNRWTTQGSPNATDWVEVNYGIARPIRTMKLYFLDDGEGKPVRAPASFELQSWSGTAWQTIPGQSKSPLQPTGHQANTVTFPLIATSRVRAVFAPQAGAGLGLTEFETWGYAKLPLPQPKLSLNNLALKAKASASYTSRFDAIGEINDGQIVMNGGRNRWTAFESPNESDWVQLDFDHPQTVSRMEVCLWADGGGVHTPKAFTIQYWDGTNWVGVKELARMPATPTLLTSNEITITPVQTTKLRLTFTHDLPGKSGVTEWLVWGPDAQP